MLPSILLIFSVDNIMAVTMRPWIEMDAADVNKVEIKKKVNFQCHSAALSSGVSAGAASIILHMRACFQT